MIRRRTVGRRRAASNTARYYHAAVRLNSGKVLVIAGSTGGATNSCELYDPSEGTWSNAASTTTARFYHAATLLADGKVLVTGGAISRYPLNSAELYNPSTNTWALTGSMTTGRYAHTATLLTDNTVLVAGGEGQSISCGKACTSYIPTAKADIYNEAAGKFTATSSLSRARAYHSATLLGTGRVLVDGGVAYNAYCCIVLGSAESYTALTLTFSASTLTFGVFQIGLTSPSQTVTVTNASSHSATFSSITTSGDFSQSNTCPATLNSGQNCTITVVFKPTAAGTRTGNLILKDNCPGSPMQTIALTGTGAANALTLLANPLRFPATIPGNSSGPMNITLYNDGAAAVHIIGMAIAPNDGTFTVTGSNCPATLNPNTNCAIQVLFTPPDAGNYSETLSVTDSDKSSPQTASLTGTGLD